MQQLVLAVQNFQEGIAQQVHLAVKVADGQHQGQIFQALPVVGQPQLQQSPAGQVQHIHPGQQQIQPVLQFLTVGGQLLPRHPPQGRKQHHADLGQEGQRKIDEGQRKGNLPEGQHTPPPVHHLTPHPQHQHGAEVGEHQAQTHGGAAAAFRRPQTQIQPRAPELPPDAHRQIGQPQPASPYVKGNQSKDPRRPGGQQEALSPQIHQFVQDQGAGIDVRLPPGLKEIAQMVVAGVEPEIHQHRQQDGPAAQVRHRQRNHPAESHRQHQLKGRPHPELTAQDGGVQFFPGFAAPAQIHPVVEPQSQTGYVGGVKHKELPPAEILRPQHPGQNQVGDAAHRQGHPLGGEGVGEIPFQRGFLHGASPFFRIRRR